MAVPSAELRVRALRFAYGRSHVLSGVDLEVLPGQIVGLVGPNGSGKSTIIKIVSGVLAPYEGSVELGGRPLTSLSRRTLAQLVAVVPQEPQFSLPFTALEVALMGRHPHLSGLGFESEADVALAHQALAHCGADGLANRRIMELSAGERQRVVFARALVQQPGLLLLDEPASFLDIRYQVEIYDLVRTLAREHGIGVLTVLHDLNLAAEYCDIACLLKSGIVQAAGPTTDVFTYANLTRVFETDMYVDVNALTGRLLVVPLPARVNRK